MGDVYRLTLRQLVRGKRPILLLLVPLAPAVIAFAYMLGGGSGTTRRDAFAGIVESVFIPIAVALVALVLGASAIGDEREDGTILYLVATPLPRRKLILGKLLAAWTAVFATCLPGLLLCLVFVFRGRLDASEVGWSIAALLGCSLAYVAVFGLLSLVVRRPVLIGFLYIVLWEGSIANVAPSADKLSIAAYGRALVAHGLGAARTFNVPKVSAATASVVLLAVSVVATLYAAHRLTRVELP